jgi:hypothetical protein
MFEPHPDRPVGGMRSDQHGFIECDTSLAFSARDADP